MDRPLTVGVFAPFVGGPYYGTLLAAITRAVSAAGGRVLAVQTLNAGAACNEQAWVPDFLPRVGWDHLAGAIAITGAVDTGYLTALQAAGRPVVLISQEAPGLVAPVVLPDNRTGVHEAVAHLVKHGHERIAFVGHRAVTDVAERYEAYREALRTHGIEPDQALCFDAGDAQETGGVQAAEAMHRAGLPSTAVLAATDTNAAGLLRTLVAKGYRLPADQAVIGFDDQPVAGYLTPALATVRQPFDLIGATATDLLLRQVRGEPVAPARYLMPTSFLARASCGCEIGTANGHAPVGDPTALTARLTALLLPVTDECRAGIATAVDAVVAVIAAAAAGRPAPTVADRRAALELLYRLNPRPETLARLIPTLRDYGRSVGSGAGVESCVQDIVLVLAEAQGRTQFQTGAYLQTTVGMQYDVSMDLLGRPDRDPRTLAWLARTRVDAACLGLWPDDPDATRDRVEIAGTFARDNPLGGPSGEIAVTAFPPAELLAAASDRPLYVVPVKTGTSDRGLLAVVADLELTVPTGRETVNQWGALLTVALDHHDVARASAEQADRLRRAALYDQLTGLPNRALFLDRLGHAMRRTKRTDSYRFAVLFLDLDGFKVVNDSLGHPAGDDLLIQVASRVAQGLRDTDTAARFGGDEFLILLDDVHDATGPAEVAERVHDALTQPFTVAGQRVVVSASIGIALSGNDYQRAEDLLRDADIAMYWAKSREKGTHAVFDVSMHTRAVTRLRIEAELRQALERAELEVYYQPIVHLGSGRTAGFEALLRWRHPTRGLVLPAEFLPIAEESGLSVPLGRYVLSEACRQLAVWRAIGSAPPGLRMSVNISNRQFWHRSLLDGLDDCLADSGLEPGSLALEITEFSLMRNHELARERLHQLRDRGIKVHVDDFGTGYSSLEALCDLPLDALKIDASFVARLGTDRRCDDLVRTITQLGSNLGLEIIAEGVETDQQRDHVDRLSTEYGQGYWFSPPVPHAVAELMLRQSRRLPAGSR